MKLFNLTRRGLILYSMIAVAGLFIVLLSCYPGEPLSINQMDIVVTVYNKSLDYSRFQTYVLPDTVVHLADSTKQDEVNRDYDAFILSQVKQNIEAMGFVEETNPEANKPDAVFLIAVAEQKYSGYYGGYWGWWGWYPGWGWWGYPGWGWYYPPGYGGYAYTFTTGTIFISMVDLENVDPENKKIPIAWSAAINGVAEDNTVNVRTRIERGIKKAFDQSPYLGQGKVK